MNPELEPSPRQKLTRFICQELLYEFVAGRLDSERQSGVGKYVEGCRDSQRELERLNRALRYTTQAAELQVSEPLRAALLEFEPHWKKTLREWTLRFGQRGWQVLPYLVAIIAVAIGLTVTKPWQRAARNELVLVEQLKAEPDMVSPPADVNVTATTVTPVQLSPVMQTSAPEPAAAPEESPLKESEEPAPQLAGVLTRGDLEATDYARDWPQIRDKIVALGGKVAGNVELGWQRRSDEAYFHFSLPESNRQELELFLKTFGPVRFSTEAHPRVMPEGQIRIILTVKDGETTHEGPTETP